MEDIQDLDHLIGQVNKSNISTIAGMVARIIAVINDPDSTAKELVEIVLTDPPLAANVLRLVNSAHYAPRRKIADIQQAVIFIGFDALKELALNQKVCEIFKKVVNLEGYSRQSLWVHSVAVAQFAKMIYRREFAMRGENAYAVGLLHDLGIIIEDQFRNASLVEALDLVKSEGLPLWQAEQRVLGYDHSRIGSAVSQNWNLPHEIIDGIANHHQPHRAPSATQVMATSLFIANYGCQQAEIGYCDAPLDDEDFYHQSIESMGIERHAIDLIQTDVQALISTMVAEGLL